MLIERLKSAIPLIAIVCAVFFAPLAYSSWLFLVLAVAMLFFACQETFDLLAPHFQKRHFTFALVMGGLMLLDAAIPFFARQFPSCGNVLHAYQSVMPGLCATIMLVAFASTFKSQPDRKTVNGILVSIGAFVFIAWQLLYFVKLFYIPTMPGEDPRIILFYMILVTKMADVGAFAVGVNTAKRPGGNHRLAPLISPKKSWEGFIGGTIFSLITSLIFTACLYNKLRINGCQVIGYVDAVIIGIMASPIGLLGDLAESAIKRAADAKDSGKLPGIGGILDTLDSLLPMGPMFYAYILLKQIVA